MRELFLLSGLGADKRVFEFLDLSGYKLIYIEWTEPKINECMEDYARRLLSQISSPNPILLGVSFGGMMAVEIGKLIPTEKIILISSAKTKSDIPFLFRLIGRLRVHKLMPAGLLKKMPFSNWFFGAESDHDQQLLHAIIRDTDKKFLSWAIEAIITWKNETTLSNLIHIHGTNDRLLPNKKADHIIQDGGHFMIVNKANEVGQILKDYLTNNP